MEIFLWRSNEYDDNGPEKENSNYQKSNGHGCVPCCERDSGYRLKPKWELHDKKTWKTFSSLFCSFFSLVSHSEPSPENGNSWKHSRTVIFICELKWKSTSWREGKITQKSCPASTYNSHKSLPRNIKWKSFSVKLFHIYKWRKKISANCQLYIMMKSNFSRRRVVEDVP